MDRRRLATGNLRTAAWAAVAALSWPGPGSVRAQDVLTQHNDVARTGMNAAEKVLTTANVNTQKFGRLWSLYADGQVVAQPLYVSKMTVDTTPGGVKGTFNAVIVATMHNTVYAYDADLENRLPDGKTKPLWATWLGQPRPGGKEIDMWSTNDPEWGILGTPVVDPEKTTVWVVAWMNENGKYKYRLFALDLRNGSQRTASVVIGGEPPNPAQPCHYPEGSYNPCLQKQRTALLLSKGVLYFAFGGDGNRGIVFAHDAATLKERARWSVTPTGTNGGIWQSGQGASADAEGNVFFITGNGAFDADRGGKNFGNSVVRLKLQTNELVPADYFAPCNFAFLNEHDYDFGSGGAVLVPGTDLLIGGGKEGIMYLLKQGNLGKFAPSATAPKCTNGNAVQQLQATDIHQHGTRTDYGHIHGSPVLWTRPGETHVYVWGELDHLKQYRLVNGRFAAAQPKKSTYRPPDGMPGGMLSLSSNQSRPGTAILWAAVPLDGDANKNRGVQGVLLALDARDVSKQLWSSELSGARDRLGLFAKFQAPTVAGGKVFVPTYGDSEPQRTWGGNQHPALLPAHYAVVVYGLLQHEHPPKAIVNQDADDVTVVSATTSALTLDVSKCTSAPAGTRDCTRALEQKTGSPSLHTLSLPEGGSFQGCSLLRVTTASKQAAINDASGIGWYAAEATAGDLEAMSTGRFLDKTQLKQVGTGKLQSGAPALLHEFVGVANCPAGTATRDRLFKPFMQFDNAPDKTYRNWDRAANYRISRATPRFDRSAEVLAR